MPINILMPALSPTMEKGNLAKWLVKEGDKVSSGDVIAEIETDKATMEVEAVDEGTVARILVQEGTSDVPVNDIIAVLAGEGEDASAAATANAPAPGGKAPAFTLGAGETGRVTGCRERAGGRRRRGRRDDRRSPGTSPDRPCGQSAQDGAQDGPGLVREAGRTGGGDAKRDAKPNGEGQGAFLLPLSPAAGARKQA
jgi:pyruvate dehydrogenase E2 component (dihydrolipoamide acetyltransferase)